MNSESNSSTFERGIRIRFGDRSLLYISGTASIDSDGEVVYIGDVRKQTARTPENITALLHQHEATPADMAYIVVYLRNPEEFEQVKDVVEHEVPRARTAYFHGGCSMQAIMAG